MTNIEPKRDSKFSPSPISSQPKNRASNGTIKLEPESEVASSSFKSLSQIVIPIPEAPMPLYKGIAR